MGESIISLAEKMRDRAIQAAMDTWEDVGSVLVDPLTGCWLWKGPVDDKGYPRHGAEMAYREVFVLVLGHELEEGIQIDHLCRRRLCIRPAHLDPVTAAENMIRKNSARRMPVRCPIGHRLSRLNVGRTPEGGIWCHQCVNPMKQEMVVMDWLDGLPR